MNNMKILVLGKFYTEGFALHIKETLLDMGHQVFCYEVGSLIANNSKSHFLSIINKMRNVLYEVTDNLPSIRNKRIKSLFKLVAMKNPDIILVCYDFLLPSEVVYLKENFPETKIAMWFPDTLVNFGRSYFMNAPYDALFFKDPFIIHALFNVLKTPVYYMPECFNPQRHFLPDGIDIEDKYKCDITTAGTLHSWRVAYYQHLTKYDVKLWGPHPPLWMPKELVNNLHPNHVVYNQDKAKAFLGAKIVLNNLLYGEIWGVNVRTFEAAGIGAFQMVDWRPGLEQLFVDGKEIITYKNLADMHEKIEYYLANPKQRQVIAEAGKIRAFKEHTYRHRLELILATLANKAKGFNLPNV